MQPADPGAASHVYLPEDADVDTVVLAEPALPDEAGDPEAEELALLAAADGDELPAGEPAGDDDPPVEAVGPTEPAGWTLRASTSAYAWGCGASGRTRSGTQVRWGVVATDPRVIPLGAALEIEGFPGTTFRAEDTGSAVIGAKVDIFWPAGCASARQYGRAAARGAGARVSMNVHPVAALFPMMADEELADLAADIQAHGLIHPLVIDAEGTLIDGRNRLAACALVDVEPTFETLDGQDPVAYILATNVTRRHLNKGQAAMAVAQAESLASKEWGAKAAASRAIRVSAARISQALLVLTHAPELADAVLAGATGLDAAYETAQTRKRAADQSEVHMARLRAEAPDLADLVAEERMTLAEAMAAHRERTQRERERRENATRVLANSLFGLWSLFDGRTRDFAEDWTTAGNPYTASNELSWLWTSEGVRVIARMLDRLANDIDARGGAL